jgi:hypothetical protein
MALDNKTSLLNTQPPRAFPGPRAREYNPYPYSDTINTYDKTALKEAVFDDDMEQLRDGLSSCLPAPPPPFMPARLLILSSQPCVPYQTQIEIRGLSWSSICSKLLIEFLMCN